MEFPMNDPNLLNSSPDTEPVTPPSEEEIQDPKEAIDLNAIFPGSEKDLNQLFLDADMKQLLKNISKNKSDLGKLNDRLWEENKVDEEEPGTESSSADAE
jgi:hypothetical protein